MRPTGRAISLLHFNEVEYGEGRNMDRLTGKVIIVTGGANGIGRTYVESLAGEGAQVVIAGIDGEKGREVAESVSNSGTDAISPTTDISDWDNVQRLVQETIGRFGRIDGLVNNAAFYQRPKVMARVPFEQIPLDEWEEMMSVNLRGGLFVLPGRGPAHEAAAVGEDRQHFLCHQFLWRRFRGPLRDIQGRRRRINQVFGQGTWRPWDNGERGGTGHHHEPGRATGTGTPHK
ncbi:MAG: hypothetical protein CL759_07950 [Chloroflexi bacterium]|nr:hypothetical protein [Chloroflexota bacterium]